MNAVATQVQANVVAELKAILPDLQAAKAAHKAAWEASQEANRAYVALRARYSELCEAAKAAKEVV
jgi:hypothetical protein